jgi:hypothetical protein
MNRKKSMKDSWNRTQDYSYDDKEHYNVKFNVNYVDIGKIKHFIYMWKCGGVVFVKSLKNQFRVQPYCLAIYQQFISNFNRSKEIICK